MLAYVGYTLIPTLGQRRPYEHCSNYCFQRSAIEPIDVEPTNDYLAIQHPTLFQHKRKDSCQYFNHWGDQIPLVQKDLNDNHIQ